MAVLMHMEWKGVTPDQYEQVRRSANWEGDLPPGAMFHAVGFGDGSMHITDIWESQADFDRFFQERLASGVQAAGIQGQPDAHFYPVHAVFAPAFEK